MKKWLRELCVFVGYFFYCYATNEGFNLVAYG